jgi:N-acetylneuraminate synthase/sialic acid synthase
LAYALGARVIEKHFTLDRNMKGTDHAFSLEPEELRLLVDWLAFARRAIGNRRKERLRSEEPALKKMGKKLVVTRRLRAGETLRREDVTWKSPGDGLPPYLLEDVIGSVVDRDLEADEAVPESVLRDKRVAG